MTGCARSGKGFLLYRNPQECSEFQSSNPSLYEIEVPFGTAPRPYSHIANLFPENINTTSLSSF